MRIQSTVRYTAVVLLVFMATQSKSGEDICPGGAFPDSNVIFCDSFESGNGQSFDASAYDPYNTDVTGGMFRTTSESAHGNYSLEAHWLAGANKAGRLEIHFGRNPLGSSIAQNEDIREIYWRWYTKLPVTFQGFPQKYNRAMSYGDTNRSPAMIAHVWGDSNDHSILLGDPVSGIQNDVLVTNGWNDFGNFSWLGQMASNTTVPKGRWLCIEAHVKLNDPGTANGVFEIYFDDNLEASRTDMDWVGKWQDFAINALHISNWWNEGSPVDQSRYLDAVVISKARIGCLGNNPQAVRPNPPENFLVID